MTLTDPSIALTYALAVRATRKRNPVAKGRQISNASASRARTLRSATILYFLVCFFICGYRELILSLARTPESRGYGTPLRGVRPSWLSGVLSVLPDGCRQRSKLAERRQTVRPALPDFPPRGTDRRIGLSDGHVLPRSCLRPHASRRPAHHRVTVGRRNEEAAPHSI